MTIDNKICPICAATAAISEVEEMKLQIKGQ
jgi:hypothetical protein